MLTLTHPHSGIRSFTKQYSSLLLMIDSGIFCSIIFCEKLTNVLQAIMSKCRCGIPAHHTVGKCLEKEEALGNTINKPLTFVELC